DEDFKVSTTKILDKKRVLQSLQRYISFITRITINPLNYGINRVFYTTFFPSQFSNSGFWICTCYRSLRSAVDVRSHSIQSNCKSERSYRKIYYDRLDRNGCYRYSNDYHERGSG